MADKSLSELIAATSLTPLDLWLIEQAGVAKSVSGQLMINFLTAAADGHGGIQSIEKLPSSGLTDTYRITLADTNFFDFTVTNGKGITGISKTDTSGLVDIYTITYNDGPATTFTVTNGRSIAEIKKIDTSGLVDTYTITYNDGPASTFTVTNGAKGDKGDTPHIWIRYASQKPTDSSPSFGLLPDNWMGQAVNYNDTAPTDWTEYEWFKIKGEKGDPGAPATLVSRQVAYQVSTSGTVPPSGEWSETVPSVAQGRYLWTRVTATFNTGEPVVSYSVARMGMDGLGSVVTVNGNGPDENGNVQLTAVDVGSLALSGGTMTGAIDMDGQPITGLNPPTEATQAVNKQYADLAAYPVGAIYISVSSTSPASLFGGTWERLKDRFLLAAGDTYSAGGTGGAAKRTLTKNNIPPLSLYYSGSSEPYRPCIAATALYTSSKQDGYADAVNTQNGNPTPVDIMPPYLAVYIWKRVA